MERKESRSQRLHKLNVLVGATGSVASIRVPMLTQALSREGANVRLVITKPACHFIQIEQKLDNASVLIYTDEDEWSQWSSLSDTVLHIELRKWAHVFVIAPMSANTMAKIANGLCDNLLTCVARAWPLSTNANANEVAKPLIVAPAMNTCMWEHPVTMDHLKRMRSFGIHVIDPICKKLACGDTGIGAMEQVDNIVDRVSEYCKELSQKP